MINRCDRRSAPLPRARPKPLSAYPGQHVTRTRAREVVATLFWRGLNLRRGAGGAPNCGHRIGHPLCDGNRPCLIVIGRRFARAFAAGPGRLRCQQSSVSRRCFAPTRSC